MQVAPLRLMEMSGAHVVYKALALVSFWLLWRGEKIVGYSEQLS